MKVFGCLVIFVIVFVTRSYASVERVFDAFAKAKVIESCFGDENSKVYISKIVNAVRECSVIPKPEKLRSLSSVPEDSGNGKLETSSASPSDAISQEYSSLFDNFNLQDIFNPSKLVKVGSRRVIPVPFAFDSEDIESLMYFRRSKRQIEDIIFNENTVRDLKNRVVNTVSNVTCILQKMKYVNEEYQLEFDFMVNEVKSLSLGPDLEADLVYGLNFCKDTTTCLPVERMRTALPHNLKRVMHFSKCYEQQKFIACMKNDLREQKDKFDLRGLDGILSNLEEDDQMLAVVWGNTILNAGKHSLYDVIFKK